MNQTNQSFSVPRRGQLQDEKEKEKIIIEKVYIKYRSKRIDHDKQEDADIQADIDKGKIVNILYDTSP